MAPTIERIDSGCASNLMRVLIRLTAPRRELAAIPGLPPVVDKLPEGCAFAERCHKANDTCRYGNIELVRHGADNFVRCIAPETAAQEACQ
ncbi:hypothetical protein N9W92_06385 [Planktomarina temperata]|nr:hypothetical protein [Planktomarina temperata]